MLDSSIFVKGSKLYNKAATKFNRSLNINNNDCRKMSEPLFQNKFTKPFKNAIKHILLTRQSSNDPEEWHAENFALYD